MVQLSWECWLVGGPLLGVLGGGEAAEGAVGSVGVVLDAPGFDDDGRLDERGELFDVQELVADAAPLKDSTKGFSHGEPGSM